METQVTEIEQLKLKLAELESKQAATPTALKLDLGCGTQKREGFTGVDRLPFGGKVDVVHDLGHHTWPWPDNSVDEVVCSHMIEHLTWTERVFFFNELYRVMKPGAKGTISLPHWCSNRYYGDPTHQAPFSEMAWLYMNKAWRKVQAPHTDSELAPGPLAYNCDFEVAYGYSIAPWMVGRDQKFQEFALGAYKEAAQDMTATLIKK